MDIYRDGKPEGLFAEGQKVEVPAKVAGMAPHPIKASKIFNGRNGTLVSQRSSVRPANRC